MGYAARVGKKANPAKGLIGKWVRGIREAHGLTQEQFAHQAGVQRDAVSGWENGNAGIHGMSIEKILRAFPGATSPMLEMSDPSVSLSPHRHTEAGTNVTTIEGIMVGQELDGIEDELLRKRARTAALAAIDAERAKHPTLPSAGGGSASRR